jgi:hypothetical protein
MSRRGSNGIGTAGFVLALVALFGSWLPVASWILWILGIIFSFIGLFRRPRGLAIAGFIISAFSLVLIITIGALILAFFKDFF